MQAYATLTANGDPCEVSEGWEGVDLEDVRISFPERTNGVDPDMPLSWADHVYVQLDGDNDAIVVSIGLSPYKGGFRMTIRRKEDGTLLLHCPHPNEQLLHKPLTLNHEGTYIINLGA